jgi:diguanylate cyclase (GGDEF)-like protein/PAS domain S-box-containing protein
MTDTTDHSLLHRLLLEALPFGVYAVNRDGKVILWSEGAEQLTGYLRQDVVGRSCQESLLSHCDSENNPLEGTAIPLLATLHEGRGASGEVSLHVKNGHLLPVRIRTVPLRDERGHLLGAAEIFEAISPQPGEDRRQSKLGAYGCLDGLTGLLNHSMIQAHLRESLSLHLVYPVPFCVMVFGVDELPELRKRCGQAGVDAALRAVAQTVEHGLRPTDFLGRWMEHEFLAILTECNESDVIKVGDRLGRLVRNNGVPWWGDKMHVTVSIGATAALDNDTVGSIVNRAERALQECSNAGGNRVVMVTA